jgi:hypothetical protein
MTENKSNKKVVKRKEKGPFGNIGQRAREKERESRYRNI